MTGCMPRQVNDCQAIPYIQRVAGIKEARWSELPKSQKRSSNRLKESSNLRQTPIRWTTLVVRCVKSRCCNPCSCLFRNPADIQNVIEVTMGYDNPNDAFAIPSALLQRLLEKVTTSDKPSVDEIEAFKVTKNAEFHSKRANL
jgi:hypothetical protein